MSLRDNAKNEINRRLGDLDFSRGNLNSDGFVVRTTNELDCWRLHSAHSCKAASIFDCWGSTTTGGRRKLAVPNGAPNEKALGLTGLRTQLCNLAPVMRTLGGFLIIDGRDMSEHVSLLRGCSLQDCADQSHDGEMDSS